MVILFGLPGDLKNPRTWTAGRTGFTEKREVQSHSPKRRLRGPPHPAPSAVSADAPHSGTGSAEAGGHLHGPVSSRPNPHRVPDVGRCSEGFLQTCPKPPGPPASPSRPGKELHNESPQNITPGIIGPPCESVPFEVAAHLPTPWAGCRIFGRDEALGTLRWPEAERPPQWGWPDSEADTTPV